MNPPPDAVDMLLKQIVLLEKQHQSLNQELLEAMSLSNSRHKLICPPPSVTVDYGASTSSCGGSEGPMSSLNFLDKLYLNMLESMGQAVHVWGTDLRIVYWNRMSEEIFGCSSDEALGQDAIELLVEPHDYAVASVIVDALLSGETWSGMFPLRHKNKKLVQVHVTSSPIYDDDGQVAAVVSVSGDVNSYTNSPCLGPKETGAGFNLSQSRRSASGIYQPLYMAISSKISDLVSKASNKMKSKLGVLEFANSAEVPVQEYGVYGTLKSPNGKKHVLRHFSNYSEKYEAESGLPCLSEKEMWMAKKEKLQLWKRGESRSPSFMRPWIHNNDQENKSCDLSSTQLSNKGEGQSSCSSLHNDNSTSSIWSSKISADSDSLDHEVTWKDLNIMDQIGEGFTATVHQGCWNGTSVALKIFSKKPYTRDLVRSFEQEVFIMKQLRHPNVLLFMSSVASPVGLCIVSEFLQRGSLQKVLHRDKTKLDWKRRAHMAMDIARGMNYLHQCDPPIIHRDLNSSNLLVHKHWMVKVGDFGMACWKNETHIIANAFKETPQWMAPEALLDEPCDEKSDVYSYGVVLWEILTQKKPWDRLDPMQVIETVGYMGHRLEIPENVEPEWVQIIKSCWHSEPQLRPTFLELMDNLRELFTTFSLRDRSMAAHHISRIGPKI